MRTAARLATWDRLTRLHILQRLQNAVALGLVLLGPVLAFATFLVLGPLDKGASALSLRLVLLADLVYVLVLVALVMQRVAQMIAATRRKSAGSRLHLRLTGVFAIMALIPTVMVAIFAGLTVNVGLEGWFSDRVRQVVGSSLAAAEAYEQEHRRDLAEDAEVLADYLDAARNANFFIADGQLRQVLTQGQSQIQRGLREAYLIDGTGEIRARGDRSYLFDYELPTRDQFNRARAGETVIIEDWDINEFRALVALNNYVDRFLYVSRSVDGEILSLLDETQETVRFYNQLESERGRLLFEFGLLYLGFAVILILASIWLGLWFAERLSRPVGRLAGAAQRVGSGDLDVQVVEEDTDDEIAMLGRVFNQMTLQLKGQRDALMETNRQIDRRRRLFDSVLSSITAGVVGVDSDGRVTFANRSAERLLRMPTLEEHSVMLAEVVPEFASLFDRLRESGLEVAQEEIRVSRAGRMENLLVRMATRRGARDQLEGYVIAFDDVTDLVSAQRMAAWGDVARRIAHEIKNPLTPIQLSAERIKRKFRKAVGEDEALLENYTDVIVRQTEDLRRIVDEFSKFARMPEPERKLQDLVKLVRESVILQEEALDGVLISADLPEDKVLADLDATMIGQALTNLIKNAGEAIDGFVLSGAPDGYIPRINIEMALEPRAALISISDNGCGFPEDRSRLFEPYVTTRDKGTGLGLPIVKKIIEEHGGTLTLSDAEPFAEGAHRGARVDIRLPVTTVEQDQGLKALAV
ncbi:MAG: PAS domain-containing sensor histidine kinase [Rhodobacteraceae bacterium]|nr:PAS domain-containing sensor histidine kinase [Paracoccaceae bacterium]